jgi:hypothetical protein
MITWKELEDVLSGMELDELDDLDRAMFIACKHLPESYTKDAGLGTVKAIVHGVNMNRRNAEAGTVKFLNRPEKIEAGQRIRVTYGSLSKEVAVGCIVTAGSNRVGVVFTSLDGCESDWEKVDDIYDINVLDLNRMIESVLVNHYQIEWIG